MKDFRAFEGFPVRRPAGTGGDSGTGRFERMVK